MAKLKIESAWESLIFHRRTLNDYYHPHPAFPLGEKKICLYSSAASGLSDCSNRLLLGRAFFIISTTWFVDFQLLQGLMLISIAVFIRGLNHTKGITLSRPWWFQAWKQQPASRLVGRGGRNRNTPFITQPCLICHSEKGSKGLYLEPSPLMPFSLKAHYHSFPFQRLSSLY